MIVKYSPAFLATMKKVNVRIRKNFKERIAVFSKNPNNPQLKNHPLRDEYTGYRSIDVTGDWRAICKEINQGENTTSYFVAIGTHDQLYGK